MKKGLIYLLFFAVLVGVFYYFLFAGTDYYKSKLPVLSRVQPFAFIDQNGNKFVNATLDGKVYATEYFFTTCKGICPKMNKNMRRVYEAFADEANFVVVSHTCMPEVDSIPLLKAYEKKLIGDMSGHKALWYFVTGSKDSLYKMARESYLLDDAKNNSENIKDQFIHTQFFALVDKKQQVRGIYDALKTDEINKLITNIKELLKESADPASFNHSSFSNNPN
ncbi:hypothetical protein BH09BAC2_BH09BAC2_04870 [soil metagenome]